ncbi:YadA C-terminal domain-containing protein [Lelliottia amnigena]|uniref:YadA C-terminal domain-containing protein n=1 Tax=Lelliottia amnigena TaxID=61646 RepID=UPI001F46A449|nr:YadA C-terminal domain-containing protein [Lelliottia amnigena]
MKKTILSGVILATLAGTSAISAPFMPMMNPEPAGSFVPSSQSPQGVTGTFNFYEGTDDSQFRVGFTQNYLYDLNAIVSNVETNQADINTKVDQTTYQQGQDRQDTAMSRKVDVNDYAQDQAAVNQHISDVGMAVGINHQDIQANHTAIVANTNALNDKVDQTDYDQNKQTTDAQLVNLTQTNDLQDTSITSNKTAIDQNATDIKINTTALAGKVNQNVYSADQTRQDNEIASKASASDLHADEQKITSNRTAIQKNATQEQTDFQVLQSGVAHAEDTGAYAQSRADAAYANTEKNRKALDATNKRVAANTTKLQNHESRIQDLEADRGYGNKFNDLKNTVDNNRKHASAGIAGVAAMANIPQVSQGSTFSMGAGAGTYDGEQGLAVGASARIGQQVVTKLTVSATTENDFVAGMGAAYEW